ncbi:unnamed protein product [Owenia fusiformis]|uniref:Uncharacterized protein n=1 Tax=Owenia fusiformis TaxID=6347 RepID=A0A8J1TS91_OWEFU|nr:unnamed protein product [Owenia fusiformis]
MGGQKRIILWCIPRTCSTAFARSIVTLKKVQYLNEKYFKPFYVGEERKSKRYDDVSDTFSECFTYKETKEIYEEEYPDFEIIFAKEMAMYLGDLVDKWENIPSGYRHTFIIREPSITVPSLYKCLTDKERNGTDYFDPMEASFEPIHQLFHLVKEQQGSTPVIINTKDLLDNPEAVMKQYCEKTGLEYSPKMLHWDAGPVEGTTWHKYPGWHGELVKSNGFKTADQLEDVINLDEMPTEVHECIKENQTYYDELKKYCLKI